MADYSNPRTCALRVKWTWPSVCGGLPQFFEYQDTEGNLRTSEASCSTGSLRPVAAVHGVQLFLR